MNHTEQIERSASLAPARENNMTATLMRSAEIVRFKNEDDAIITKAMTILLRRISRSGIELGSPATVKNFLTLKLAQQEREVFGVLWLDVKNRLIAYDEMFFGTLTHTSVYPREMVKTALKFNSASAILFHNHPSGSPEPSPADHSLTRTTKQALALVDVRVLDHIIVGGTETYSFAEHGVC